MKKSMRALALTTTAALAVTACGGGGAASSPDAALAEGIQARFDDGMAFEVAFDGDMEAALADLGEPVPEPMLELLGGSLMSGAYRADVGMAMAFGDLFEIRAVDEAVYLRVDLEAAAELGGETMDPADPAAVGTTLPPSLQDAYSALTTGGWVGVTGLSAEAMQDLAGSMGAPAPDQTADEDAVQQLRDALAEQDMGDAASFVETYLVVTGDGPTYDVTVKARELATALEALSAEVDAAAGTSGASADLPDTGDVPEEISGITATVEGGELTEVRIDGAALAESTGADAAEVDELGDTTMLMTMTDVDDQLDAPDAAATVAFEDLMGAIMGMMLGGMGDMGDMGGAGDLGDLPPELLEELPTEMLSELPTPS
jgi:hypothetical protein